MYEAYTDDKERGNVVLSLTPKLAPYKVSILPLVKKDPIGPKAKEIYDELIDEDIVAFYDESGSVGKRYARSDEIGTPYCVTVDYETIEDGEHKDTVTIRDRDSTKQVRVKVDDLSSTISKLVKGKVDFSQL
jgi:glycyl-tRNA synthetase